MENYLSPRPERTKSRITVYGIKNKENPQEGQNLLNYHRKVISSKARALSCIKNYPVPPLPRVPLKESKKRKKREER